MTHIESWPILREGRWLYDGTQPVALRLLASPETWGTGDYEDEASVAENQPVPCIFIAYEAAGSPGVFCNLIPNLPSLEEAVREAESRFPGVEWLRR